MTPLPGPTHPDPDPLPDPQPLRGGIGQLYRAVEYATPEGYRPLVLDLYTPVASRSAAPPPVVLFLHGGGWRLGSRRVFCPTWRDWEPDPFHRLVAAGFAVASIDYRLSGEAVFPAQLDDARVALDWLRTRADELGVDGNRIVAWGESAGAHLAALLGLTTDGIAGVIDWYGPADLRTVGEQSLPNAVARPDAPDSRESTLIGAPVPDAPDLARAASPVAHVHAAAPPFHIAHGLADRFVPAAQSRQLADALTAAGVDVEVTLIPEVDHMWIGLRDPDDVFTAALGFARRVTGGGPATITTIATPTGTGTGTA